MAASDSSRDLLLQITDSIRRYVESLHETGVTGLPRVAAPAQEETEKRRNGETEKSGSAPRFPDSFLLPALGLSHRQRQV